VSQTNPNQTSSQSLIDEEGDEDDEEGIEIERVDELFEGGMGGHTEEIRALFGTMNTQSSLFQSGG
jgi:hypothetical protein